MSILLEKTVEPQIHSKVELGFHLRMACGTLTVLIISFIGCKLTSIHTDIGGRVIAIVMTLAMVAPLPIYWHEKGRTALREAALVIPWELLLAATLSFPVLIAARLRLPLQDSLFAHIDQSLGVNLRGLGDGAVRNGLGRGLTKVISGCFPFLEEGASGPPLWGRRRKERGSSSGS